MGKKSQLQEALDTLNREIDDLIQVRARLEAVRPTFTPKRERKPRKAKPQPVEAELAGT